METISTRTSFIRVIDDANGITASCMRVNVNIEQVGVLGKPPDPYKLADALLALNTTLPGRPATEDDLRPKNSRSGGFGAEVQASERAYSMDELRAVEQAINRAGHEGAVEGSPEAATTAAAR